MKKLLVSSFLSILALGVFAQTGIVNNGAALIIRPGAKAIISGGNDGNLTLNTGSTLVLGGWLTIEGTLSNNGTAILEENGSLLENGLLGTEQILLRKTVNNGDTDLFSSPITGLIAADFTPAVVEKFDETTSDWLELNASDALNNMTGYRLTSPSNTLLEFSGDINSGEYSLTLPASVDGWNLIGNPYPSGIDLKSVFKSNSAIHPTLYAWNGYNYTYYQSGTELSINGGTSFVGPGSALFIKTNTSGPIRFDNELRLHQPANLAPSNLKDYVKISVTNGSYIDEAIISFMSGAKQDFDVEYDSYKLFSDTPGVPQIYTESVGTAYSINSLPLPDTITEVPIKFQSFTNDAFTFEFKNYAFENLEALYLEDKNLDGQLDAIYLNGHLVRSSYVFDYNTGDGVDRFALHFFPIAIPTGFLPAKETTFINAYSHGKTLYVKLDLPGLIDITLYSIQGKYAFKGRVHNGLNTFHLDESPEGIYLVTAMVKGALYTKKILIH